MSPELELAEQRAALAKARMGDTVAALQARLEPRAIVRDAMDGGQQAVRSGLGAARRHPGAVAGAGAVLIAFLARNRIAGLLRKARRRETVPATARSPSDRRADRPRGTER